MKMNVRAYLVMLGLAAAVTAAACGGDGAQAEPTETVRTVPVRTAKVEIRDLTEMLTLTGTLDPRAEVTVVPELSARLLSTMKDEGDRVTKGQLLAVLDDADFRLARDRAKASLDVLSETVADRGVPSLDRDAHGAPPFCLVWGRSFPDRRRANGHSPTVFPRRSARRARQRTCV